MIKYNDNNISKWFDGGSSIKKVYHNNHVCFQSAISGSTPPPTPTAMKFSATYSGGATYSAECDGNTTLTSGNTRPEGYTFSAMTSAVIGDCITSIGNNAFGHCRSLSSITIPDSVTSIGHSAFNYCSGLTSITLPSGLTSISDYLFGSCISLSSITIPSGVTSIGGSAFGGCGLTSITIPDSVTSIGHSSFSSCENLTTCSFGSGLTSIDQQAFQYCALTSVTIPDSVTSIGNATFRDCDNLTNVSIGSGLTIIAGTVFEGCNSLTSITIPDTVQRIGLGSFHGCNHLTSVIIGSGVTSIGGSAFLSCSSLSSITINATVPPTLDDLPFGDTKNCPIYVPAASVDAYKAASVWSNYASRIQAIPSPYVLPTPFVINYNVKNYDSTAFTLYKTDGQLYDYNAEISGNTSGIVYNNDSITIPNSQAVIAVLKSGTTVGDLFNRTNNDPEITIVTKAYGTDSSGGNILANRHYGIDGVLVDHYNWMYRQRTNTLRFHGTSEQGSVAVSNSTPNICSVRVDSGRTLTLDNYTSGTTDSRSNFSYGTSNEYGPVLFNGGYKNGGMSEDWHGTFYWIYMTKRCLTDEEVQQVIDYNENL